jgi:hypothetical protein
MKEFWHLGTVERCTFRLKPGESSEKPSGELFFTDGIVHEGHVYIPLQTFCRELRISRDDLLADDFLECLKRIHRRDKIFPIQKLDIKD